MKISLDTESEELSELKATIAIIEDAIKRRENPEPEEIIEEKNNKTIIKEIVLELSKLNPNHPIKIEDIVQKAEENNILEQEVLELIKELQESGEI